MTTQEALVPEEDRLLGAGSEITLLDGSELKVRYGFLGQKRLAKTYGTYFDYAEAIVSAFDGKRDIGTVVLDGLVAATGKSEDDLDAVLDPARLADYLGAIASAFFESLPTEAQKMLQAKMKEAAGASTGPAATTSRGSATGTRKKSSGK